MGMNQMIVLEARREGRDAQDAPEAQESQPCPINAAPTTLFEVIDRAVSAVLAQFDRWCDRDEREDEAHFEDYVRWRVAIIDDAAAQARTLMVAEGLTAEGSPWLAAHARA
jgi:hypothetical protein